MKISAMQLQLLGSYKPSLFCHDSLFLLVSNFDLLSPWVYFNAGTNCGQLYNENNV